MEDRNSWNVKDDAILFDLSALMNLTDEEKQALAASKPHAEEIAPQLINAFYERLLSHSNTAEYFNGNGMIEHLRGTLEAWFIQLFSGNYDSDYVNSRLTIGKTHVRIGLPVRYPLAMMDVLIEFGEKIAQANGNAEVTGRAFRKLAALDIAIFNQAYEDTQLDHLAEVVGNERLARRLLTK
ncbi:MAG: Globin-coupled histidine kinase [Anaerolineae bacterium]|nr:Globin-coupled histidine kinase [Anaerolineae bacterium]